jgi:short-subunit dehydrogenase
MPNAAVYTASKHFVRAFTESLGAQLQSTGVTVSEAALGPVESEVDQVAGIEGGATPGQSLHDREENLKVATLRDATHAVSAAVVMFHAQFGSHFGTGDQKNSVIQKCLSNCRAAFEDTRGSSTYRG